MPQLVINPEASAAEQHEFVFAEPVEDALMDHLPGVSAVDDMLGLTDVELRKAVDRDVREELQHVRPLEAAFPVVGARRAVPLPVVNFHHSGGREQSAAADATGRHHAEPSGGRTATG